MPFAHAVVPLDPAPLVITAAVVLYVRAIRELGRRGVEVSARQQLAWYGGIALYTLALVYPLPPLGDDLFSAHMAEHLLIADLGAPLLLIGARSPVLYFLLPHRVGRPLMRSRRLRALGRTLTRPLVAIALYGVSLYAWHVSALFEGAVENVIVHALQHTSFVLASVLVWWSALEPGRKRLRGELWKIPHIIGARLPGMFLGMAFVVMQAPVYDGVYEGAHGIGALQDQQIGGAMMLLLDSAIVVAALVFFFFRAAADEDRRQAREAELPVGP